MADRSAIEWTEATWNPIVGCSRVSEGCRNCYAERLAGTRLKHLETYADATFDTPSGRRWSGKVGLRHKELRKPGGWQKPRRIFVCSMGDLFHESVPDQWIDEVFEVMGFSTQHTFQVLTKRPDRAQDSITDSYRRLWSEWGITWPLPNVWLGVSVENQEAADQRIPFLLETPAAVRFVSCEPLLEEVGISWALMENYEPLPGMVRETKLDWVICGGETGPGAREMNPDWARSLRDQCRTAGVPFFMKQMSRKQPIPADLMIREYPEVRQ